jgi:uncharacterized protein (UPF0276 family)
MQEELRAGQSSVYSRVAEKAKCKFLLNLALIYVNSGEMGKAHDILNEYLLTQPDSPDARDALKEIEGEK